MSAKLGFQGGLSRLGRGQRIDRDGPPEDSMPQCPFCQIPSDQSLVLAIVVPILIELLA